MRRARTGKRCATHALALAGLGVLGVELEPPGGAALDPGVQAAVGRGVDWLLDQQELDGSWDESLEPYRNGATGLALYALLSAGVSPGHPAVKRAVAFLGSENPTRTYSLACQLMALSRLGDPEREGWIEELAEGLMDWQQEGGFSYPEGPNDISNTQYAALGLRAAEQAGAPVPERVWTGLAEYTLALEEVDERGAAQGGFGYRSGARPTGSLTAAGVSVLSICAPRMSSRRSRELGVEEALARGISWLAEHFAVDHDPGGGGRSPWLYYYLYGLERVAALNELERIGLHDWYAEGAQQLLGAQSGAGSWRSSAGARQVSNTAFALLFLVRATAPVTGEARSASRPTYGADNPDAQLSLRAAGDDPLDVWVSSFGDAALTANAWPEDGGGGLRVRKVEYLLPGGDLLADERVSALDWRWTTRVPDGEFWQSTFDDGRWSRGRGAFGTPGGIEPGVRSQWTTPRLYLRRSFMLRGEELVAPSILLTRSGARTAVVGEALEEGALECLFEENPLFIELLGAGAEQVDFLDGEAAHGSGCLRVRPPGMRAPRISGWRHSIRRRPDVGEQRYLRFAWYAPGGGRVELALECADGRRVRYVAGVQAAPADAILIDRASPAGWIVVERDLWTDLGGDAEVVGLSLELEGGEGVLLDSLWLARSSADWGQLRGGRWLAVESLPGASSLRVWLNGELLYAGRRVTRGPEVLSTRKPLAELLSPGRNVLAAELYRAGPEDCLDLSVRDHSLLGSSLGTVLAPHGAERFAARLELPRPGVYELLGRAIVAPPGDAFASRVLLSRPLRVRVRAAADAELLGYAGDAGRNRLRASVPEVVASSERGGASGAAAVDGLLARPWLCAARDEQPVLRIQLQRPVRADRLLLCHPPERMAGALARVVRVRLNGDAEARLLDMQANRQRKLVWEFGEARRVRSLELEILEVVGGGLGRSSVGFAEVELQLGSRDG